MHQKHAGKFWEGRVAGDGHGGTFDLSKQRPVANPNPASDRHTLSSFGPPSCFDASPPQETPNQNAEWAILVIKKEMFALASEDERNLVRTVETLCVIAVFRGASAFQYGELLMNQSFESLRVQDKRPRNDSHL